MSRARDFADLAGAADAGGLTGRNLIINGAMQVWQRGTTIDTISNGGYLCDRWRLAHSGTDGNVDVDRSTDVPSGQGFAYSQKISMDASETSLDAADQINVHQRLEGQDLQQLAKGTSNAKKTVCSFWVRSSVASTYTLELQDSDNNRSISKTYTIDAADTWEKKEVVFDGDTTGALNNDNGRSMDVRWWIDAGSNYTSGTLATSWATVTTANRVSATTGWLESTSPEFYITGIQWELGETATPFEHESFTSQWNKCQRYCTVYNIGGGDVHPENYILQHHAPPGKPGHVDVNNRGEWMLEWPFKRAAPTLTFTDGDNMRFGVGNNGLVNASGNPSMSVGTSPEGGTVFQSVSSGITLGASDVSGIICNWMKQATGNNPKIVIDAEL